jgi:nucleotide-binding universal stress UspA family protein
MSTYHQILVPVDGSPVSDAALLEAIRFAHLTGARLRLVHVVDVLQYVNGFEPPASYANDILPRMRAAGEKILAHGRQMALDQGVQADSVLITEAPGRLCDQIAEQATQAKADLIVVGSHGRRGIGRALLGSDAEQIVRYAPVPVLVVRAIGAPT